MIKQTTIAGTALVLVLAFVGTGFTKDLDLQPRDKRSDLDKRLDEAKQAYDAHRRQQEQRKLDELNPPLHKGRLPVSPHGSLGGSLKPGGGEINYKYDYR